MRLSSPHLRALLALLLLFPVSAVAQKSIAAVLLSDIHFDPFHNPALLPQLRAAPPERWPAILDTAPSTIGDAAALADLQATCHSRAPDTDWTLLKTSLEAAHDATLRPVFVTLSGDLLTHDFPCRFHHLAPDANAADLASFSAKTVAFVAAQLRLAFPGTPVYLALGNNDSGCADYRETPGSDFLRSFAQAVNPASTRGPGGQLAVSPTGDYSVALPAPLVRGRLVVLNDIFESREFQTCAGSSDNHAAEAAQLRWLRDQLTSARALHQQVWVMGHLPPGVDVYSSYSRYILRAAEMCAARPKPFLADTAVADTLLDFADVVRLALFAHTHMDEVRLLQHAPHASGPSSPDAAAAAPAAIPVKLVPSITPWAGNHPAFLLVSVDPQTLVLKDWETVVSPSPSGSTPPWTTAYRFSSTFHLPDFSAASAAKLASAFTADATGRGTEASSYRQHFYPGDIGLYALGLAQIWPAYACAVREYAPAAMHGCLCPGTFPSPTPPSAPPAP